MMLGGASVFGVVDHIWNGELFLLGPKMIWDLMLGTTMTGAIAGFWAVFAAYSGRAPAKAVT